MTENRKTNKLVSVGMPVYNEASHLPEALESLISQDYANLEIIVSDNASTDGTFEVMEEFAKKDDRIRLHRFATNQGPRLNLLKTKQMARGEYFMIAGGHDLWSQNHISSCVSLLESHPLACLAFASSMWIGNNGEMLDKESGYTDTRGLDPMGRFLTVLWGNMHPIYGVIRKSAMDKVGNIRKVTGADLLFLGELSLRGDFLHAPQAVWYRRELRFETDYKQKLKRLSRKYSKFQLQRFFPLALLPIELMRIILRSDLKAMEKTALFMALVAAFPARYMAGVKSA